MSDDQGARLKARARHLWELDGKPRGREDEYLERARELIAIEDSPGAGLLPNPAAGGRQPPATEEPVEEAFLEDNLGEFPSRLTDQGDRPQTPHRRSADEG